MDEEKAGPKGMNRRDFITMTSLGLGAAAVGAGFKVGEAAAEVPKKWDRQADVLVVGTGYAGLAAAIEVHDAGAKVVIFEKMPTIGGNSIIAGGAYNAVDPERQKAKGIKDSTDLHFEQTIAGGDFRADPVKVRYYVEHALEGWQWLEKMGVENILLYQVYGALWPRTHRPKYKDKPTNGASIVAALFDQVKARKIPVMMEHKVTRIFREQPAEGKVLGLQVEARGKKLNYKAKRAVVLASGGFCADVEMRMRHDPRYDARFGTTCHPGSTGEVLNQAQDIGADIIGIDFIQSIGPTGPDVRYVKPPAGTVALLGSIMMSMGGLTVNRCVYTDLKGNRIVAADARRDYITEAGMRTPEMVCVGIGDDISRQNTTYGEMPVAKLEKMMQEHPKELFRADTLAELARKMGMPDPAVLEEAVKKYNSYVDAKKDPEFGQLPHNLIWKCEKPPFWGCTASPALHHMCGGLRTKGNSTVVLDRWNKPIPRLFAAGEIAGGVHGSNRLGGNATGDCIVYGRLAGREAVAEKPLA